MEEIDKITRFIKDKLSIYETSIINFPSTLEVRKAILNVLNIHENYLIIVDSDNKKNYWNSITISNKNVVVIDSDDLIHYHYTKNNLIVDIYPGTFNKSMYGSLNSVYTGTTWILVENALLTAVENISDRIQGNVKLINLKSSDLKPFYAADNLIYLLEQDLDDKQETELYKYYSGIPFKKDHGSYSEFIPVFQQNSVTELCITPSDKYKLLASKYFFYKKKRANDIRQEFIKNKTRDSYFEIKDFLEKKRLDVIEDVIKDSKNNFFIYFKKIHERIENYAIRNGISIASNSQSIESYRFGLKRALASSEIEHVADFTDYVILGDLGPTTTVNIKNLTTVFACPIIIPFFKNTRDTNIINKVKQNFKTVKITSLERFRKIRIGY
ncbi:MAG: hypothetical protein ACOC3V_00890 [bacterium]